VEAKNIEGFVIWTHQIQVATADDDDDEHDVAFVAVAFFKPPITPKNVFTLVKSFYATRKNTRIFLHLVKT